MNIRKVIQRRIRYASKGVDVVGDVNAVIAANVDERSSSKKSPRTKPRKSKEGAS